MILGVAFDDRPSQNLGEALESAQAIVYAAQLTSAYRVRPASHAAEPSEFDRGRRVLRRGALWCLAALLAAPVTAFFHPGLAFAVGYAGLAMLFMSWIGFWHETGTAIIGTRTLTMMTMGSLGLSVVSALTVLGL